MRPGSSMGHGGTGDLGTTLIIQGDRLSVSSRGDAHPLTAAQAARNQEKLGEGSSPSPNAFQSISIRWS